ncbi:LysM peptidoglycan-binding domain-containing protein [Candidatus Roizmanbacteria bacterium]|nr:LysM peptidoglycan-binding domain-containing protein [Candidatus Roizmanbacteria bacterium]
MKNPALPINYRILLSTKIKENLSSFITGIVVVFLSLSAIFFFIISSFQSVNFGKKEAKPEVISETKKVRTYTVQEGDQLWLIAQKLYGSGFNMDDIMKANNITDPNLIEVGKSLIIPDVKPKFPTTGNVASGVQTEQVTKTEDTYVVKQGDSLASIALQFYGDTFAWTKIAQANNLTNPDILTTGNVLKIPK